MLYYLSYIWPYRLTVRTSAFQAGNPGSIPGRVTRRKMSPHLCGLFSYVTLSKVSAYFASGKRSPIRFSVLTETNRDTGHVMTDKCTHGPGMLILNSQYYDYVVLSACYIN